MIGEQLQCNNSAVVTELLDKISLTESILDLAEYMKDNQAVLGFDRGHRGTQYAYWNANMEAPCRACQASEEQAARESGMADLECEELTEVRDRVLQFSDGEKNCTAYGLAR